MTSEQGEWTQIASAYLALQSELRSRVRGPRLLAKEPISPLVDIASRIYACGVILVKREVPQCNILEPI